MAKLDDYSRLLIPKEVLTISSLNVSKTAFLIFDDKLREFFLSSSIVDKQFIVATVKLDKKGRITLSSNIKEALEINSDSNIIVAYLDSRIYLLRKNIFK